MALAFAKEQLKALVAMEGYPLLKGLANALVEQYEGPVPNGTQESQTRYLNGAIMRKGFQLLFEEVEREYRQAEPSFVQQMMRATINQPREVIKETERL